MAANKTAVPSPEELLTEKTAELEALKTEFQKKTEEFQAKDALYSATAEELEALKAEFAETKEKPAEVVPGLEFEFEGKSLKFKDNAPKKIRVNGEAKTQKEIVKDKDLLLQLVGGNSGLIQKI